MRRDPQAQDLIVRDLTPGDAQILRHALNESHDFRIGDPRATLIAIKPLAAFLTQPAGFKHPLQNR